MESGGFEHQACLEGLPSGIADDPGRVGPDVNEINDEVQAGGVQRSQQAGGLGITELRLVVTAEDYAAALAFYRDALGLPERAAFESPGGHVTILEAGRATLEIADPSHAAYIDAVEVGQRVAGQIRVAFRVGDAAAATRVAEQAGATVLAEPVRTPWNSSNARLDGPAGLQLTLFEELEELD